MPAGRTRSTARRSRSKAFFCYTRHEPVGVVGQIIPWNFLLLMQAWKWGARLGDGLHHGAQARRADAAHAARRPACPGSRHPDGVINVVPGFGPTAARPSPGTWTSTRWRSPANTPPARSSWRPPRAAISTRHAGIGRQEPERRLRRCRSRCRGRGIAFRFVLQSGPRCCAGSRLFVEDSIHDKFVEKLLKKTKNTKVGDPFDPDTTQGPQVSQEQCDRIMSYIDAGKKEAPSCSPAAIASVPRLLCRADGVRQCQRRHEDRQGRDLRARDEHPAFQGHRRSDPPRQPDVLRPRRRGLDATSPRPIAWLTACGPAPSGSTATMSSTPPPCSAASRCPASAANSANTLQNYTEVKDCHRANVMFYEPRFFGNRG